MRILGFCEGARADSGGIGLIGVPLIHQALAQRGHHDILAISGHPMPSALSLCTRLEDVVDTLSGNASVVAFPSVGRWCFSPRLYRAAATLASRANVLTLHSLYSYPVLAGYALALKYKKPYGLWPHGVLAPVQRQVAAARKAVYGGLIARRILDSASVLFYSAAGERDEARELRLKVPSVVIPHGIDFRSYAGLPTQGAFRRKYLGGHKGCLVLYLGRLNIKKGLDLLVEGMARVVRSIPDTMLAIVGGGHPPAFTQQVRQWVEAAGLAGKVALTGPLDEVDKRTALADCDVFVLPSVAENFGFAMFEAMASGRPVICSDTLNYAGEVAKHDAGIAVRRTSDELAAAIVLLLGDRVRRRTLGANGQRLARAYSWEACGEKLELAVRCIINKQPFPTNLEPE